jgi:hypothetical protein
MISEKYEVVSQNIPSFFQTVILISYPFLPNNKSQTEKISINLVTSIVIRIQIALKNPDFDPSLFVKINIYWRIHS